MSEEIMVTVIATGFNRRSMLEDIPGGIKEQKERTSSQTRSLSERENVPVHQRPNKEELINKDNQDESLKPKLFFDDTKPPLYGNDLEVPAFIRRQHD